MHEDLETLESFYGIGSKNPYARGKEIDEITARFILNIYGAKGYSKTSDNVYFWTFIR